MSFFRGTTVTTPGGLFANRIYPARGKTNRHTTPTTARRVASRPRQGEASSRTSRVESGTDEWSASDTDSRRAAVNSAASLAGRRTSICGNQTEAATPPYISATAAAPVDGVPLLISPSALSQRDLYRVAEQDFWRNGRINCGNFSPD